MSIQEQSINKFSRRGGQLLLRASLISVGLIVVVGTAAPFINAGAFRGALQNSLEEALGRQVDVGAVYFTLFTGPGFTLEGVTIHEDPHYGLEPFAYIPTLQVRVRLDKLLLGQIRPLGLRMIDASINLVKSNDGSWNAVSLVERLGAPRRSPLNFLPAVQLSNGRIDFKLGTRKTTLYITDTDVSIYPQRSGKIYFKFEGSPARTDRAGNGFGHLTGTANWYLAQPSPTANQLEADVNLEPSNLSELATLFWGQDLGVHGTLSAHVLVSGPFSGLHALGDMRLEDVHRWDLLPSAGDNWRVRFQAGVDLRSHKLDLTTLAPGPGEAPVTLRLSANNFMTKPSWSVLASLRKAPLASLLPLGRRMGIALPAGLKMDGALDGVVGYSNTTGLEGGVVITNAVANVPDIPPLRSASANVTISAANIHIEPAILQADSGGTLQAGGDFNLDTQNLNADISVDQFSVASFKETTAAWFGSPDALALFQSGLLSGRFVVANGPAQKPSWSGQLQFTDCTLNVPGSVVPIKYLQGNATFDETSFELPHMNGLIGLAAFSGSYRYNLNFKRPERLRLDFAEADLAQLEADLAPTLSDDSLLSHLPFTRRAIPTWLANRGIEGDLTVAHCSIHQNLLGPLAAHFIWQGTAVQLTSLHLGLPAGTIQGTGAIALSARLPRYHFEMQINGYPWGGGLVSADGTVESSGTGVMLLQHLQADGSFTSEDVAFTGVDPFTSLAGQFDFAFDGDKPALKLTKVAARQDDEDWSGEGVSNRDGKLLLDLTNGPRQLHLMTDLSASADVAGNSR